MYKIELIRRREYQNVKRPDSNKKAESSTISTFEVFNDEGELVFSCFALENGGPSTDTPNRDKRIVPRKYKLYWTESSVVLPKEYRPKCISLYTDELKSFKGRRIHIHVGNYPQDTEGCILLNENDNGNGTCSQSRKAVKEFYDLVSKAGIENFELFIYDI